MSEPQPVSNRGRSASPLRMVWSRYPVRVTGHDLCLDDVASVARRAASATLPKHTELALARSHRTLREQVHGGLLVYGWTTGVGALDRERITRRDNRAHQKRLLRSHAAGAGAPMPEDQVRALILSRANMLAAAESGVRPVVIRALLGLLNRGVTPRVPERGSVGAADLAPLAHVGLVLIGEGRAVVDGQLMNGAQALARSDLRPIELEGRDALAIMNGLAQTVGVGALATCDAERLVRSAEVAAALTMVATGSNGAQLDARIVASRPHAGVVESAGRLRFLLAGGEGRPAFREPLSTRAGHQVTGAAREAITRARHVLEIELNSPSDNPLPDGAGHPSANASNFHGQVVGEALEGLATSLASLAVVAEQRIGRLLDANRNGGLPAFLVHPHAGPASGLMIAQYTAASLVAELRTRAVPASLQSLSTCAGTEDHVSMASLSARRAAWTVETVEAVIALELLAAAQAVDLREARLPPALMPAYEAIRARVPVMVEDREIAADLEALLPLVRAGL